MGCLPVLISDYVLQPYEPEMDWTAFSVKLEQAKIAQLHETLASISVERYGHGLNTAFNCHACLVFGAAAAAAAASQGVGRAMHTWHGRPATFPALPPRGALIPACAACATCRYEEMQDALRCGAQHMIFSTSSGAFMHEDGK